MKLVEVPHFHVFVAGKTQGTAACPWCLCSFSFWDIITNESLGLSYYCLVLLLNKKAEGCLVIAAAFEGNPRFCLSATGYTAC